MTIDQLDVIDITVTSENASEVRLIIADHLPWDVGEAEHLWLLQCKINKYLGAIESRELFEKLPAAVDKHIVIELIPKYPLSPNARILVEKFQALIRSFGFELRVSQAYLAPRSDINLNRRPKSALDLQ